MSKKKQTPPPPRRRTVIYTLECLSGCEGDQRTIKATQDEMPAAQRCSVKGHGFRAIRKSELGTVDA